MYQIMQMTALSHPLYPGTNPWSNLIDILQEKNGADSELLVFAMTLINKVRIKGGPFAEHVRGH